MHLYKLPPDVPVELELKTQFIKEFWTALYEEGDSGATNWEALDRLYDKVKTALRKRPARIILAESLTAQAALLITGTGTS